MIMKKRYYYFILILGLAACSKEEETIIQSDTVPSISLSKPTDQQTVYLGQKFYNEGLATDEEGLSAIHYSIESPYASYNYTSSISITASGKDQDFNNGFLISENASVGEATLKVYCVDTDNNKSDVIYRKIIIKDDIPPSITMLKDSVEGGNIIEVQAFKNSNNVVDSLVIINQTKSETLAIITDKGGFKSFNFSANKMDLVNNFQNSYTHQFTVMSFYEYDGPGVVINFIGY